MDIEARALALVNEVAGGPVSTYVSFKRDNSHLTEALCRALERHEAFRQEVSDAVEAYGRSFGEPMQDDDFAEHLSHFIIAKSDPLVEALKELDGTPDPEWSYADDAEKLRAALASRGLEIREVVE